MLYHNILIAAENLDKDKRVLERGRDLASHAHGKVSVIHAVEDMGYMAYAIPSFVEFDNERKKEAQNELSEMAQTYHISLEDELLSEGSPSEVITEKAKEVGADLIVIGNHHRFLGSTTSAVLKSAPCDILAVRE